MARSKIEIAAELLRSAPRWWQEDGASVRITDMLARGLAFVEAQIQGWLEQLFITTADGDYLDDIGAEMGIPRFPGETDDAYRVRLVWGARDVAPRLIEQKCNEIITHYLGDGWPVAITEPLQMFTGTDMFSDTPGYITVEDHTYPKQPKHLFWLVLPVWPVLGTTGAAFADQDFADDCFAGDSQGLAPQYRFLTIAILDYVQDARAAGVAYGVSVVDMPSPAILDGLFGELPGGMIQDNAI